MKKTIEKSQIITIALIPFLFLIAIGLIKFDNVTVYMKVFKTYLIFIFDVFLLIILTIKLLSDKKDFGKNKKFLVYFTAYFLFVFIQYIISFLSGEVSYDRNYHFSNYIMLLIFALFFYLYLDNIEEIKIGLIIIDIMVIVLFIWAVIEILQMRKDMISDASNGGAAFSWASLLLQFRPKISFGNTDYFSGFMLGIFPLMILTPFIIYNTIKKNYIIPIISGIVVIFGALLIYASQTIAAWIGIIVGIIIVLIPCVIMMPNKLSRIVKIILLISFVLFILFIVIGIPLIISNSNLPIAKDLLPRLIAKASNPMFALNDRFNGWSGSLGLFKSHPVFGAGLGTAYASSFKYMSKYYYIYSDSNSFKHAHGEFIEVLGEGGIFGLIFFVLLFGFILFSLFKFVFSKRYDFKYRLICLGVTVGIISMLIHQIFSLSLRMSVTMTAYFFLIGLGVFLISFSKRALIEVENETADNNFLNFLNGPFIKKDKLILLSTLFILLIVSLFLFLPVLSCESKIVKVIPLGSKPEKETDYYLNEAIKAMPGNPYAWTYKFTYDSEVKLTSYFESIDSNDREGSLDRINKCFDQIIFDLDKINSIIPGYQDVWANYAKTYFTKFRYQQEVFLRTNNINYLSDSRQSMEKSLSYTNKSLEMNFLNPSTHIYKIYLTTRQENKIQFQDAVRDYFIARIYIDFARSKKIVKENINISFSDSDKTDLIIEKNLYNFKINSGDIKNLVDKTYPIEDLDSLQETLNNEILNYFSVFNIKNKIKTDSSESKIKNENE